MIVSVVGFMTAYLLSLYVNEIFGMVFFVSMLVITVAGFFRFIELLWRSGRMKRVSAYWGLISSGLIVVVGSILYISRQPDIGILVVMQFGIAIFLWGWERQ